MGVSGLGKETSIIGGTALGPPDFRKPSTWGPWCGKALLVVAPIALWLLYIHLRIGKAGDVGARNFAPPFTGLVDKIQDIVSGNDKRRRRPRRDDPQAGPHGRGSGSWPSSSSLPFASAGGTPWWRVGATYAFLMVFLGARSGSPILGAPPPGSFFP